MQLIVAEKPSVARDLARVLGVRTMGQHSFEGDRVVITWCIGHLVELDEPAAYDPRWKAWRLDTLPMLPADFRLRPSKHAVAQLNTVTRLLSERRFTTVVNACDAGREGELIFRYVYRFAGGGPPIQRLWISSLTDEAIRRGFAALRPGSQFEPLGDAARSRSEADWLVGMNATRAVTARGREAGHSALYSIGRVQTPTLAMLVIREQAIRAFVPRAYWEIRGDFRTVAGDRFSAGWRLGTVARLGTAALADTIAERDRAHGGAADGVGPRVERVRARTVREPAPLLFDLTSLQRTANRRFGFSAARTLEIAQALYERHKVLTYPRTDSRHLTKDVVPELPALFAALGAITEYAPFTAELLANPPRPGRRIVDDAKVHDHHAIIPTGKVVRGLDRDEGRLFDLVVRRFLGVFYPDAELAVTEAWIRVGAPAVVVSAPPATAGGEPGRTGSDAPILEILPPPPDRYLARGRVRVVAGWQAVAGIDGGEERRGGADRDAEAESSAVLPPLVEGQALDGTFVPLAKHTVPPHRYTEATLLGAMESAGKAIDDEALRIAMKDCGLGTPATRAAVIETLIKRDYIVRAKQQLVPTAIGIGLIETLPVASLASAELTGTWEARLARIARGEESRASFMADIARYVRDTVDAIRTSSFAAPPRSPGSGLGSGPASAPPIAEIDRGQPRTAPAPASLASQPDLRTGSPRHAPTLDERKPRHVTNTGPAGSPLAETFPRNRPVSDPERLDERNPRQSPPVSKNTNTGRSRSSLAETFSRKPAPEPLRQGSPPVSENITNTGRSGSSLAEAFPRKRPTSTLVRLDGRKPHPTPAARITLDGRKPRSATPARDHDTHDRRKPQPAPKPAARDRVTLDSRGARLAPKSVRDHVARSAQRGTSPSGQRSVDVAALGCPRCSAGTLIAGARGWGCSRWRAGCGFVVWFETAGRRLSATQLSDLVTRGKTRKARFVSERGAAIDGRLVLDPACGVRLEPA